MKTTTSLAIAFGLAAMTASIFIGSSRSESAHDALHAAQTQFNETLKSADDTVAFLGSTPSFRRIDAATVATAAENCGIQLEQARSFLAELEALQSPPQR